VPTAELRKERTMRNPQRLIGRHNLYKEYIQQYKNNLRQLSRLFKDIREDNLLSRNQKDELIGTISDLQRQLQFYK
jgi:hypothetical protein